MSTATLLVYLILNTSFQWQFESVVHLNGTGALPYCEEMRRWKDEAYSGKIGDMKVLCTDDKGENI